MAVVVVVTVVRRVLMVVVVVKAAVVVGGATVATIYMATIWRGFFGVFDEQQSECFSFVFAGGYKSLQ